MLVKIERDESRSDIWGFDEQAGEEVVAAAKRLQPLLRANAAAGEAQRYPMPEVIAALDEADLFAVCVPKRLGGRGASSTAFARMGAELAKGDPSVAWVTQIINGTTWVTTLGPDILQDELFANGVPKIAGSFNPPGTAVPVEGGYLVTGAWPYASGIRHCAWGQWGIKIVHPDGTVVPGNFCYIPQEEFTIENSWYVTGLQGTGSDTVTVKDHFVPERRVVHATRSYDYVEPGKRHYGAASDYLARIAMVHRTMTGVPLGCAEALLAHIVENATVKPLVGTLFARQSDSQVVAKDIGEAAVKIDSARQLIENATSTIDRAALAKQTLSERERAQNKAQANYAMVILAEAMQSLMYIAGSAGFNDSNPASRYWNDFNMAARHFGNIPNVGFEVYGRSLLGVTPSAIPPFMY